MNVKNKESRFCKNVMGGAKALPDSNNIIIKKLYYKSRLDLTKNQSNRIINNAYQNKHFVYCVVRYTKESILLDSAA